MFAAVFENLGEPAHRARVRFITTALRQKGELTLGVPLLGSRRTMCIALAKLRASPTNKQCGAFNPTGIASFSLGLRFLRATLGCEVAESSTLKGLDPRGSSSFEVNFLNRGAGPAATLSELARLFGVRVPRVVAARQPLG